MAGITDDITKQNRLTQTHFFITHGMSSKIWEDADMEREPVGPCDRPRNQLGMLLQSKRFMFQGTPGNVHCCGGAPVPVIEAEMTIGTLESALPVRVLEFREK